MSDFGVLTEGQLIDQRDEAIEQRDTAMQRCETARRERDAVTLKYDELSRALLSLRPDLVGKTPLEVVRKLGDGVVSFADLTRIRERYGALYDAVFPVVPELIKEIITHADVDRFKPVVACEILEQIEACR